MPNCKVKKSKQLGFAFHPVENLLHEVTSKLGLDQIDRESTNRDAF